MTLQEQVRLLVEFPGLLAVLHQLGIGALEKEVALEIMVVGFEEPEVIVPSGRYVIQEICHWLCLKVDSRAARSRQDLEGEEENHQ